MDLEGLEFHSQKEVYAAMLMIAQGRYFQAVQDYLTTGSPTHISRMITERESIVRVLVKMKSLDDSSGGINPVGQMINPSLNNSTNLDAEGLTVTTPK